MKLIKSPLLCIIFAALFLSGCATTSIKTTSTSNPPPTEAFNQFNQFEFEPVTLADAYKGQDANTKSLVKIQSELSN